MSDTDIVVSGDHQPQQQPQTEPQQRTREKQVTLSQSDLDDVTTSLLFNDQERIFIENLNVDEESKNEKRKIFDTTVVPVETVPPPPPVATVNMDDLKMFVLKCVSRQDISPNFAAVEAGFYDKVELCVDEMTPGSFFKIEEFVNTRLERVIMHSKVFSENVCEKLATEERELYIELCECVNKFRKRMNERLKNDK